MVDTISKASVYPVNGEFKHEFEQMCENYGNKAKQGNSHNPQTNAIMSEYKGVNDMLRSFDLDNEIRGI
jgi:hypothetical protein